MSDFAKFMLLLAASLLLCAIALGDYQQGRFGWSLIEALIALGLALYSGVPMRRFTRDLRR
jgi:hypothetical protein